MKLLTALLAPASILYGLSANADRWFKKRRAFVSRLPVVSIGNISTGGSGKTQVVETLLGPLQERGPVILLSRGYGRQDRQSRIWRPGDRAVDPALFGDEPAMLSRSLHSGVIAVSTDRADLLRSIEDDYPDAIVLLDDGFQHHLLARDLDIVLIDAQTAQERFLLPAGRLRERPTALGRADLILVSGEVAESFARRHAPDIPTLRMKVEVQGLGSVAGFTQNPTGDAILVTGIARPERVRDSLAELRIIPVMEITFRDHHQYTPSDARLILESMNTSGANWIVTTRKDAVKLERLSEIRDLLYVLDVAMKIEDMPALLTIIDDVVRLRSATGTGPAATGDR